MTFGFSDSRETFVSSFLFLEKFWFCGDKIESIELPNVVPRLHLDDCSKIHILHEELCDLKSPNFSARGTAAPVRLLQGGPCFLGPFVDVAVSVLREMRINIVFHRYHFSSRL